jgi:methyltransferase
LAVIALERLLEVFLSKRNAARILDQGGQEWGAGHYPTMVLLHTALFPACLLEVHFLHRPWNPTLAWAMGALIGATMCLRYWAIWSLGEHWNTRVIVLPEAQRVTRGPYRWMRHPNYLAVVLELAAIPLFHGAWICALGFGSANLLLLRHRIRVEERALSILASGTT